MRRIGRVAGPIGRVARPIGRVARPIGRVARRRRRKAEVIDSGVCVEWDKDDTTFPSRRWYLCTAKDESDDDTSCQIIDESIPGYEGVQMWACSVPIVRPPPDFGMFYDDMMA